MVWVPNVSKQDSNRLNAALNGCREPGHSRVERLIQAARNACRCREHAEDSRRRQEILVEELQKRSAVVDDRVSGRRAILLQQARRPLGDPPFEVEFLRLLKRGQMANTHRCRQSRDLPERYAHGK
jgi:hypothetical protein